MILTNKLFDKYMSSKDDKYLIIVSEDYKKINDIIDSFNVSNKEIVNEKKNENVKENANIQTNIIKSNTSINSNIMKISIFKECESELYTLTEGVKYFYLYISKGKIEEFFPL